MVGGWGVFFHQPCEVVTTTVQVRLKQASRWGAVITPAKTSVSLCFAGGAVWASSERDHGRVSPPARESDTDEPHSWSHIVRIRFFF